MIPGRSDDSWEEEEEKKEKNPGGKKRIRRAERGGAAEQVTSACSIYQAGVERRSPKSWMSFHVQHKPKISREPSTESTKCTTQSTQQVPAQSNLY